MINRKLLYSAVAILLVFALMGTFVTGVLPGDVRAASSSELKDQLDELKKDKEALMGKIEELEKQQSENFGDMESIIKQKDIIDQQVALLYAEISNVNDQIATYSRLIADKQKELEQAQQRLAELSAKNKERIRAMEEGGGLSYWSVLFKANSFSDLLDRLNMIYEIAVADQRRMEEMSQAAKVVEEARKVLTEEKAELEKTKAELENTRKTLDTKNAEADRLLDDLVKIAENLEDLHNQFEKEEEDFLNQIAQKDKEYTDKLNEEASISASIQASIEASIAESKWLQASIEESIRQEQMGTQPTTGSKPGTGSTNNPSGVVWMVPCKYTYLSSPFGYRWHPTTGQWSMHQGVDFAAPKGTPIYATRSGTITIATYSSTAGNYVQINHGDGYSSVYMHMTHFVVSVGEYVKAGELIGYVGSTGRSTGPHLHFGISKNGSYVNPMDYLD
jgi:murein DD-endopeptidase MepM/ murein hydrolase activator NlpD